MTVFHLCRDCLTGWQAADPESLCHGCGSARIVGHPELDDLSIVHLDCDAFYAAVEIRDDPSLDGLPLIIGGGRRGVVATCSYEARRFGIHSAMPMFKALELCPDATVLRPNMGKYQVESRRIRELMNEVTPLVEPVSIDEAFLDLTGTADVHGGSPVRTVARLIKRIESEIGITASLGLSYNKFLAKLASDLDKPRGLTVIGRAEARSFLAPQPVRRIWGVGPVLERRLAADGITTIGDLQRTSDTELAVRYGKMGTRLAHLARGEDERTVAPRAPRKSLSSETTFEEDVARFDELKAILWRQCERVARGLKQEGLAGRTVTLKIKTSDFKLKTRSRSLDSPTQLAEMIYQTAAPLLRKEADGTRYRLIGVGVADFRPIGEADPLDLFAAGSSREAELERAVDTVRGRFGDQVITKGRGREPEPGRRRSH